MEEINLKELFSYMLSKIVIIIVLTVVLVVGSIVYREFFKEPLYQSSTTIVLARSSNVSIEDGTTGITQNEILLNQKLVSTYREIIKSRRILEKVIEKLELDITYKELTNSISVTNQEDTEIIKITVSNPNKEDAKNIADAIASTFSTEIAKIYSIQNISVIDYARQSNEPYNINPVKETALAAIIGIVLGCGIVFVMFYFDTTIKSVEEIEEKIKLPVLGAVPKTNLSKGGK